MAPTTLVAAKRIAKRMTENSILPRMPLSSADRTAPPQNLPCGAKEDARRGTAR